MKLEKTLTIQTIRDWFAENAEEYQRVYESGMGVRGLEIDGNFLRTADEKTMTTFWNAVSQQLPDDTTFVYWMDTSFVLQAAMEGNYIDRYMILLASKEWEQVGEGNFIPRIYVSRRMGHRLGHR